MRHIIFEEAESYKVALLVKNTAFNKQELLNNYVYLLDAAGVANNEVIAFTAEYDDKGKASATFIKEYLSKLLPVLDSLQVKTLYVADSGYFKVIAGQVKAEGHLGYVLPCKIKGYEHMNVILGLNHTALIYNPELLRKLTLSLNALIGHVQGTYQAPGNSIIHSAQYPKTYEAISKVLLELHKHPSLAVDIEAFSLQFNKAGIGTIAFAWDEHNGVAFACDYAKYLIQPAEMFFGCSIANPGVRKLLKEFFVNYQGKLTWHNAAYDIKVLIYTLWMKNGLDTEGMLEGIEVMTRSIHDTKIIAYLAVNSTAGNVLRLKALAHEFAGNYANGIEIKDIRKVSLQKLLEYNLVDALSTKYVENLYLPVLYQDDQIDIYENLMLPSLKLLLQTELTGMPLSPVKVKEARAKLESIVEEHLNVLNTSPVIKVLNLVLQNSNLEKDNAKLKTKQHTIDKYADLVFNPNSGPQMQRLLYEQMCLPVIDLTDTKQPATGADTLKKLVNHTQVPEYKALLNALIGYGQANKVLTTFIPAFENATEKSDGIWWLHGSFNLGGTVSGRLSSSDPNLQNIPANSIYGELIKGCFVSPAGWLFCGADFNSLEDMISALTTKDPNKLKVYTDGFDGHCLRAFSYFKDQCVDIVDTVESINSIKKKYPELRQDSKIPTFALTYQGTWHTLVANLGLEKEKAQSIEANYHELYKVSDEYTEKRLHQASKDGYVTVAFGLRVRTPLLSQVVWGSSKVPFEALAEGRTAGNALGQSYGLLNNRAAVDFFRKVWASKYRLDVKPVGLIHDAIYILVRDDIEVVHWVNQELIKSMQWQELPELQHATVKLGAALDIFWPSWANATTIPNNANRETIINICNATKGEILKAV